MRTLLVTGPGGAGTTTLAAAAAVRVARSGRRTLLLSRQAPPVTALAAEPGLTVTTVDPQGAVEGVWAGAADAVGAVLPQVALPPASSVVPLPGAADLALLAELARAEADLVVVDAGPIDSALALVGLPATLRWWLDQLMPPGMRALGAVRTAAVASGAVRRGPVDAALSLVPVVEALLAADRLADPTGTGVHLVAAPRPGSAAALRAAATVLGLHGLRAASVLSRVLPLPGEDDWTTRRAGEQEAALGALADIAPVRRVDELAVAPDGADALAALLAEELPAGTGFPPPAPERHEGAWRLRVPLPFAEHGTVTLTRWVDDLVLTVQGVRRSLRLDPLLRRCEVTGGRLADPGTADACLEVGFRPDPQLWPTDLLSAEERTS
ncbi:ArsA-related P-loop ATPase [Blastococcus haudaquaticus]|uniref:Arsenite efflux ATP-binding protein ArsA n=1 Tax=Blastococcus haudaquaticus TaxID=1938745 RepID=A0A286H4X4_9ACTN|nr:ArsA-related P-loop ATPase [Blastococcus haudaquaticus]SOE02845.1 arsenite efflux ATP-binding protein ArsA [Blastococcus haudaquaticus]